MVATAKHYVAFHHQQATDSTRVISFLLFKNLKTKPFSNKAIPRERFFAGLLKK
ncbi:hypothetical protein [Enterococcus xiangfangensis]|uniref:hypothetical protein n=1 Tax=Enterococcus xiangfangensis TaxID=1296537 RepID=UPI003D17ACF6